MTSRYVSVWDGTELSLVNDRIGFDSECVSQDNSGALTKIGVTILDARV